MRAAALLAVLALACNGADRSGAAAAPARQPAPAPQKTKIPDELERGNLLNIALGASVVSRTAELTLDQSAVRAIDGDPLSSWNSPPGDFKNQTIVFALPARTRIEQIGIKTPLPNIFRVTAVQVDTSLDSSSFTPLITLQLKPADGVQSFRVPPRDAVYVRVTVLDAAGPYAKLESVQVRGTEQEPVVQKPIAGCWSINGFASAFAEDRGRVTGTIASTQPVSLDGGSDGRVYRFVWISGPDYGFGAIDTAPDGKHLSGLRWYVEPIDFASAESWFGERSTCAQSVAAVDVPAQFLKRGGRYPMYGLRFDSQGALVENDSAAALDFLANLARQPASHRWRLTSREYRQPGAVENRRRAQVRLDSLRAALQKRGIDPARFEWTPLGSDTPVRPIETEMQRVLYSVVELQSL